MINQIETILKNNYSDSYDTISKISEDDSDKSNIISLINSNIQSINFDDKFMLKFLNGRKKSKSVDMLDIKNNSINLIEFKNRSLDYTGIEEDIKLKSVESLIILFEFLEKEKIIDKFYKLFLFNINFYLVYSSNKTKIRDRLKINRTKLRNFKNYYEKKYFSRIEIIDEKYFLENYL